MRSALADFRIESEAVVRLDFSDGRSFRVHPRDLGNYIGSKDVVVVRRALRLRQHFISRVLPPTMMVLLVAAIVGLGNHDLHQVQAWMRSATPTRVVHPVQPVTQPAAPVIHPAVDTPPAAPRQHLAQTAPVTSPTVTQPAAAHIAATPAAQHVAAHVNAGLLPIPVAHQAVQMVQNTAGKLPDLP